MSNANHPISCPAPLLDHELVPERVEGGLKGFDRGGRAPLPSGVSRVVITRARRYVEECHSLAGSDLEKLPGERVCGDMNRAGQEVGPRLADEWCVFAQMTTRKNPSGGAGHSPGGWSPRPLADEEHSRRCARSSAITLTCASIGSLTFYLRHLRLGQIQFPSLPKSLGRMDRK